MKPKVTHLKHRPKAETVGLAGPAVNVIATLCDCSTPLAKIMSAAIAFLTRASLMPRLRKVLLDAYHARFAIARYEGANIVPTSGLTLLAKAWGDGLVSLAEVEPNKSALGTGIGAPAAGDTTLDTEAYRKNIASQSFSANVAYNTAFYTASEVSGTFYEHGIFANGTGAADSGTLCSRVLLNAPSGIAKGLTNTLTIEHQHTFVFNP